MADAKCSRALLRDLARLGRARPALAGSHPAASDPMASSS
jgi:hypothetical protein